MMETLIVLPMLLAVVVDGQPDAVANSSMAMGNLIVIAIASVAGALTAIANVILQILSRIEASKAEIKADAKTEEAKEKLQTAEASTTEKLDNLKKVTQDTHVLVNSNMGTQLKINAALSRELAEIKQTKVYIDAAEIAEKALAEHLARQDAVDNVVKAK